jgi:ArsR family transcriptional regulator
MTFSWNEEAPGSSKSLPLQRPSALAREPASHTANGPQIIPDSTAKSLVELFKLLADETRLRILSLLQQCEELNVRTLCQLLRQSQPAVSHHLALLRVAGLIDMRRDGKHNFYRLLPQRLEELTSLMFSVSTSGPNQIRFKDFILSYAHIGDTSKDGGQQDHERILGIRASRV